MLTANALNGYKQKDLAQMAKQRGIAGWHAMRKEELIKALLKVADVGKNPASPRRTAAATAGKAAARNRPSSSKPKDPRILRKIRAAHAEREQRKDLAALYAADLQADGRPHHDRVVLMVRDPYWLHVCWELTERSVERARAALAEKWHAARPVLQLVKLIRGALETTSEEVVRVIDIHGAVCNWYIDVDEPPRTFRVDIGYLTSENRFYALARSNVITTPPAQGAEMLDQNWANVAVDSDRIFAMSGGLGPAATGELQALFEERLQRPMGSPMMTRFGNGAEAALGECRPMNFQVDAEMIVYGVADPDAFVTMGGEPVRLSADGSFTARLPMPDKRQVIPIVAGRGDGVEERTIVLAVERNTKEMEPVLREPGQ